MNNKKDKIDYDYNRILCGDFENYNALKNAIKEWFGNEPFRVGYSGYLPGTKEIIESVNPKYTADPLLNIVKKLADELKLKLDLVPFEWSSFFSDIENEKLDTIVDPILSTIERETIIVPNSILTSGYMLYSRDLHAYIKLNYSARVKKLRTIYNVLSPTFDVPFDITEQLEKLRSRTKGLVVRSGFIESDILIRAKVEAERIDCSTGFHEYAKDSALNEEKVVFLDKHSLVELKKSITDKELNRLRDCFMFGSPIYTIAGFPIKKSNRLLQRFIRYHLLAEDGIVRTGLIMPDESVVQAYKEVGITLRSPEQIQYHLAALSFSPSLCNGKNIFHETILGWPSTTYMLNDPQSRRDMEAKVLDTVFSTGDVGLDLFFKLAANGQIDMYEVTQVIDATSAAIFVSTLINEGYAYFEGESIVANEPLCILSKKMKRDH